MLSFEILLADSSSSRGNESSYWIPATVLPPTGNSVALNPDDTIGIGATAFFAKDPVPLAVRYAHGDFPTGSLHNQEGLPMAPFVLTLPRAG